MADIGVRPSFRYSAFISYSHHDSVFVRRLHRHLETYRLPRRLRGAGARITAQGRLGPVFRDREELGAAGDLTASVRAALADAAHLIVVCSAHAEASVWVRREIALFRELHGPGAIFAVLIDGATEQGFQALFSGDDGQAAEPLAADFRRSGDGRRLAFLKLMAGLADVRLDALVQRDAQRRVRRISVISFGSLGLGAAMGVLAVVAVEARNAAVREEARGESLIEYMLTDMRGRLKSVGRLDLLDALNKGATAYYASQDLARMPASALEQRAKLLQAVGEDDESRGQLTEAAAQFDEAARTTKALLDEAPDNQGRIFAHAQSEFWVGQVALELGDYDAVGPHFKAYFDLARKLVSQAPHDPDMRMEFGYAQSSMGTFCMRILKNFKGAERYYDGALSDFRTADALRPNDPNIIVQLAEVYAWLGDVRRLQGNCDGASEARDSEYGLLTKLQERDSRDVQLKTELIENELAMGRIELCRSAWTAAIDRFRHGHDDAHELVTADLENASLREQERIFELFEADAWMSVEKASRLPDSVLRSRIGDCGAEAARPNNNELAAFCFVLTARRLAILGDRGGLNTALERAGALAGRPGQGLSAKWGIDFLSEIKSLREFGGHLVLQAGSRTPYIGEQLPPSASNNEH